ERDRAQVLVARRVVQIDRVARLVDVEHATVRARLEAHPRPAGELDLVRHAPVLEIEGPELVPAHLRVQPVGALAARSEREADAGSWAERVEVDALLGQVDAGDAHDAAVLGGVAHPEEAPGEPQLPLT